MQSTHSWEYGQFNERVTHHFTIVNRQWVNLAMHTTVWETSSMGNHRLLVYTHTHSVVAIGRETCYNQSVCGAAREKKPNRCTKHFPIKIPSMLYCCACVEHHNILYLRSPGSMFVCHVRTDAINVYENRKYTR